jgi:hypothetical protein
MKARQIGSLGWIIKFEKLELGSGSIFKSSGSFRLEKVRLVTALDTLIIDELFLYLKVKTKNKYFLG